MKVSKNVKNNLDKYMFDEINCFEKPMGIICESLCTEYSHLFYLLVKLIQAYKFENYKFDVIGENVDKRIALDVMKNFLGINIWLDECKEDFVIEWIREEISKDNFIVIPGNLNDLFYSKYYHKRDWPHYFLIYGYDKINGLFYTYDSAQSYKENSALYKQFVIEEATMKKIYTSYIDKFSKDVYIISCTEIYNNFDVYKVINNIFKFILNNKLNLNRFRELDLIDALQNNNDIEENDYLVQRLLRIKKAKGVFLNELKYIIKQFVLTPKLNKEIDIIEKRLLFEWEKYINRTILNMYEGKYENKLENFDAVYELEKKLFEIISNTYLTFKTNCSCMKKNECSNFQNNEDNIISYEKDKYLFSFSGEKTYSSYGIDDSPKVLLKKIVPNSSVMVKTKIQLTEYNDNSKFHAGIYIRTEDDSLYFWGSCCGKSIRLDLCGINNNIIDILNNADAVTLYVKIINSKIVIGLYDNGIEKEVLSYKTKTDVCEVGIGCKTWGKENLKIKFINSIVK